MFRQPPRESELARHDVFVSYSSRDKAIADSVVHWLESAGVRCWIAPRDPVPGRNYGAQIV
jgi:hypothetical protein